VANRNTIRTAQGELLLTIPVSKPKGSEGKAGYREITFGDESWRAKHLRTIEQAYRGAPHFARLFPELERIVTEGSSFCDLNVELIRWMAAEFGIGTPAPLMSELGDEFGHGNEMIVELCRATSADVYLSGAGAAAYNDPARLAADGIELRYQEFRHPVYPQLGDGFFPNLSALDMLLNCGGWVDAETDD
jgi:hypothetical protein